MSELHKAFIAAQAEMPSVAADATNPHFRSQFVSLDHLIAETRPILNKHGLGILQEPCLFGGGPALRTRLFHVSGEEFCEVTPLILAGQDMQKLGAAITYARRYAWASLLGIGEPDDDGETASGRPVKRAAPKIGPNVITNPATPPTPDAAPITGRQQEPPPDTDTGQARVGGLSLLDMAREAARHGNRFYYGAFWDMRSVAEKKEIAKIRDELNTLMKLADAALAD